MRLLSLVALALVTTAAAAQRTQWKQEPRSFLGIALGKPLADSLPVCPKSANGKYDLNGTAECWYVTSGDQSWIAHVPEFFGVYVRTLNGRVADIEGFFKHAEFDEIEKRLIAQYGEPQWRNHPTTPTKEGRELPDKGLHRWGVDVNVTCNSQWVIEDQGSVSAYNKAWERQIQFWATHDPPRPKR